VDADGRPVDRLACLTRRADGDLAIELGAEGSWT
jgi:hypothetical protein